MRAISGLGWWCGPGHYVFTPTRVEVELKDNWDWPINVEEEKKKKINVREDSIIKNRLNLGQFQQRTLILKNHLRYVRLEVCEV
jgi:hypothetical protein